ncbi:interferon alpha/beta receptor 1 isoform X6 [Syngnathus scovelli]|uniref:interferon alpha/beta receptor 1 isoform X6 n=1 Tax=Syngnathus scovelli TaxID=161590 RepID=UPI0035CAD166
MAFLLICFHFVAQVFSETLPALPQDVLFDNWQVTWTSASEESTVSYTVRYSSFDSDLWKDVPTCKQINFTSCKVTSIKAEAEHGCVMLGVQAERRGLTSDLVRACSRQGTPCSPEVRLSARPGFFTVYLSRKNGIALEGDHIKHRIYFGKEGEHLEIYEDAVSSVSINNLKEGERYCAKVQYTYFDHPVGLSSCTQCEVIPQSMASAVLSPPRNVRLTSMNMNLVLRWDSPEGVTGDIFYTTECKDGSMSSGVTGKEHTAEATWVPAVATFLVMTMAITLVVIAVFYRRRISHFLCPKDKLPENLLAASSLPLSWATHNHDQLEEIYNSVNVIAEKRSVEEL